MEKILEEQKPTNYFCSISCDSHVSRVLTAGNEMNVDSEAYFDRGPFETSRRLSLGSEHQSYFNIAGADNLTPVDLTQRGYSLPPRTLQRTFTMKSFRTRLSIEKSYSCTDRFPDYWFPFSHLTFQTSFVNRD